MAQARHIVNIILHYIMVIACQPWWLHMSEKLELFMAF